MTITVTDRIDPGLPTVSVADARGNEADGQLVFDVTLSRVADRAVNVAFATGDGTAKAGEDYEARTGTASIAAGGRATQVVVRLRIDLFSEPDETLTLTLSRAAGARLGDAQATGVIEDPAEDVRRAASKLWLARFSRMVGGQVMSTSGDRIASDRGGGIATHHRRHPPHRRQWRGCLGFRRPRPLRPGRLWLGPVRGLAQRLVALSGGLERAGAAGRRPLEQ